MPSIVTFSRVPILRLMDMMVLSGLTMDWRLASCPTRRSPSLVVATTEGLPGRDESLMLLSQRPDDSEAPDTDGAPDVDGAPGGSEASA